MMDWDRITQTGARTPGVRAVPGPILRYRCGLRSQTQCWGFFCGRLIDTKDGDKLEAYFAHAGSELKRVAYRKVPSDMHIFQPYWGKPPYGMIERVVETSASFEARSAPRSYSPAGAVSDDRSYRVRMDSMRTLL